jgi:hypothetical protein
LRHPNIKKVVKTFKTQLLELNTANYPAFKTAIFITLLTLILLDDTYRVETYNIDLIDELDIAYSFYYTGDETQRETIYDLLLNDENRATVKSKIDTEELQTKIAGLMEAKIVPVNKEFKYMFDNEKTRTGAFLNAYLN